MDFFILVTGTDAGEREDYMTEKIREYSMNGALIIGVDNGYGNMKVRWWILCHWRGKKGFCGR